MTVFCENLSEFAILVSAFLRCCTPALTAPKVFTSIERVRMRFPALKFLLNWIQNQNESPSLYRDYKYPRDSEKADDLVTSTSEVF